MPTKTGLPNRPTGSTVRHDRNHKVRKEALPEKHKIQTNEILRGHPKTVAWTDFFLSLSAKAGLFLELHV